MRWLLMLITLIFIIECVDSFKKQLQGYRPDSYFLGRGIPGHLGNIPNFLQLVGGRAGLSVRNPHREYPIDFQSLLQRLDNKMMLGTLDKDELKFIYDASGASCSHGANFTVDPYPEHKQECQAITCFCITKNSYLCSYESNCIALLKNDLTIPENEDESGKETQAENITSNEYYDEEGNEEGDYDEEQEEETNEENQEVYEDEGEYEEDEQEEQYEQATKDEHKNIVLCEEGSIHRLNNFHIPPCMVCLCLDHWTMFCTTKSLKLCLYDNNRDESGQIIKDGRVKHKTGLGMLNDVDLLKSALDEMTAVKDWAEEKKLYSYKKH